MHDVTIPRETLESVERRRGVLHPFARFEPARAALVVVDMQNTFVAPGGLAEVPGARAIVPNINRIAELLRRSGGTVIWIRGHVESRRGPWSLYLRHFERDPDAWRAALAPGSEGWELYPDLDVRVDDLFVDKDRYSAFYGPDDLDGQLRARGIETVIVCGTLTSSCCESTARDAMQHDYATIMVLDGNAGKTDAQHLNTMCTFLMSFGDVLTTAQVCDRAESCLAARARGGAMTGDRLRSMAEAAAAQLVPGETLQLAARMVDIPSPSGNERALAEMVAGFMAENGLDGRCQAVDGELCNAIGRLPGSGDGAELMLFAPLDTAFAGTETADGPFLGTPMRDDQIPVARIEGKILTGLGAHNPKGHGSAAVMAAICLARAGAPLPGDVVVALAGGGMPTNLPPGDGRPGRRIGHGAGCAFLLEQGTRPDYAIVVKPGPPAWEEVGLCWFRVTVRGLLGYAGTRHVVAHANPILAAAKVIEDLEAWFAEYSEANASGAPCVRRARSAASVPAGLRNRLSSPRSARSISISARRLSPAPPKCAGNSQPRSSPSARPMPASTSAGRRSSPCPPPARIGTAGSSVRRSAPGSA